MSFAPKQIFHQIVSYIETAIEVLDKNSDLQEVFSGFSKVLGYHYVLRYRIKHSASAIIKITHGEVPSRKEITALVGLIQWVPYFVARNFDQGRREGTQFLNALDRVKAKQSTNIKAEAALDKLMKDVKGMSSTPPGGKFFTS